MKNDDEPLSNGRFGRKLLGNRRVFDHLFSIACFLLWCSKTTVDAVRNRAPMGKQVVDVRLLLLHDTGHDLPAIESVLQARGYVVRSLAVNALTLFDEVDQWNPEIILIAADAAARDIMEQICVATQFRERPIVVFTEDDDPVAMRSAMQARVSAYVVAGLNPKRLKPVIDVALERFREDQRQLAELAEAQRVAEAERNAQRTVTRAKALLRRRGLSESDAYAALRSTAMRERCTIAEAAHRLVSGAAETSRA